MPMLACVEIEIEFTAHDACLGDLEARRLFRYAFGLYICRINYQLT